MPNVTKFHSERNNEDWQNEVKNLLGKFNGKFIFQKADGSIREMTCTLQESVVPETKGNKRKTTNSMVVYDTVAEGWRTVVYDKIIDFKVL